MNDKIQSCLVFVATIATIVFNALAAPGRLGGVATNVASDRNPTVITPAGYAFAIWSLIYVGLIVFSIYQLFPSTHEKLRKIRRPYIISCVLNCAWLWLWAYEQLAICSFVIVLLLASLAYINRQLVTTSSNPEYWIVKGTFGIYFGWVTAASLVNLMIALVANGLPLGYQTYLGVAFLIAAGTLAVAVRVNITNYFYPLSIAWAATAIAVKQSGKTAIVAACAVAVIMSLLASVSFVMSQPSRRTV